MAAPRDGWSFACPDWAEKLAGGESLLPDLPLDKEAAAKAVAVFNLLRLPDVPGQPYMSEAAGDWQRDIIAAVFGSVDDEGVRHVREPFVLVPKKNSKTTGGAAIMLAALILETTANQEFHLYGPTQAVAELAFWQIVGMIRADESGYLTKRFHVKEHRQTIECRNTRSKLRVKTFDMKIATGTIPKGVLLDELHIMSTMSYAARVIGQIKGGMITRSDSFMITITTQSDQPPAGVFKSHLQLARGIRDGRVTGDAANMLPILYEMPEDMQRSGAWREPKSWPMVLPNLGLSITLDRLVKEWAEAQEKGEEEIRRWASQHLNVEIGLALHSDRWRGADYWEAAADRSITLERLLERCEVVVVGIDGGGLDDLFGLCVAGRDRETRDWLFWCHAYALRAVLQLRPEIASALEDFERDGDLTLVDVAADIPVLVGALVKRIYDSGLLPEKAGVGLDPQLIGAVLDELALYGIGEPLVTSVTQGWALSSAVWHMEFKLQAETLWHDGSPLMAFCVGNARSEQRGNAVYISKATSGKAKIDPLVAAFNATKLLERNPAAAVPENPAILVLG